MHIKLTLKNPFDTFFGFRQTEIDVPDESTVAEVMQMLIEAHDMEGDLRKKYLIDKDGLRALYVLNKEDGGKSMIRNDFILKEMDSLTILSAVLGG